VPFSVKLQFLMPDIWALWHSGP